MIDTALEMDYIGKEDIALLQQWKQSPQTWTGNKNNEYAWSDPRAYSFYFYLFLIRFETIHQKLSGS